jgi:hypothetical protein
MATTTNYGWTTPDDTDLVKDGAAAIRTLGSSVDTSFVDLLGGTTGQVLTKASGTDLDFSFTTLDTGALTLVKTQTIGTTVSSVTVTDAFSATYENYLITVSGGIGSTNSDVSLKLGATATGYYYFEIYGTYGSNTVNGFSGSNATSVRDFGIMSPNSLDCNARIFAPEAAKRTSWSSNWSSSATGQTTGWNNGFVNDATQYTAFTLTPNTGTMTGGTIRVYGFKNS